MWNIRPFGEADIAGLAALANAIHEAEGLPYRATEEEITRQNSEPGFDPARHRLLVDGPAPGSLAGAARLIPSRDAEKGERVYELRVSVHPSERGRGLDEELARRMLERARECEAAETEPVEHVLVRAYADNKQQERAALWKRLGLREVRRWYSMERSLHEPVEEPRPVEGLLLRTYRRPEDDEAMLAAGLASFADHYGFSAARFTGEWQHWNALPDTRPELSWVAEIEGSPGRIAGFCMSYIYERTDAKGALITWVGTVPEWRRRGVARALLLHTLHSMRGASLDLADLNVDAESLSGANRVYESAGFRVVHEAVQYEGDLGGGDS